MSSILDHLTELQVFVDDLLSAPPALRHWRHSPPARPVLTDSEVRALALLPGCLGVASLQQTYRWVAGNDRSAFPRWCSYPHWRARLQNRSAPISTLLPARTQLPAGSPAFYRVASQPLPVGHALRHGRVRLLREAGASWGKTSQGWFFGV